MCVTLSLLTWLAADLKCQYTGFQTSLLRHQGRFRVKLSWYICLAKWYPKTLRGVETLVQVLPLSARNEEAQAPQQNWD